ncbi:MAG TPA: sulfotransferase, partial [Acidimicrobiales bacterium]|nr:sulfotransferase [Acidimicrobiales bacterium]
RDRVDVEAIGRYWSERLRLMLRRCADERDVLPPGQTIDVRFDEFMADDVAMVARVYRLAGQPLDDAARSAMTRFMAEHPRGKFGAVAYDPADFGLDPGTLRRQTDFYTERFGVTRES